MTKSMPKRITITLPNPVYDRLTALSEIRDKPPATLAAEAVEKLVEQAKESGELPVEPAKTDK
ncbi:hypothetical protein [Pseudanabaena sp. FACHB-2040]|uniref:hypothetical protein n=1 Tax=Pseudanabaena sp. FACHB-2040 TaxID=2692859 RepID=UPI0016858B9D|nr:hypothetical protein [Pseudanabaena sp. FACHB-2040]MBD2261052.1 hypothetical protein [Pseudanabaena sp. FACHB-2040]